MKMYYELADGSTMTSKHQAIPIRELRKHTNKKANKL